ncbi:hypothetical protein Vi05172_g10595 [Venturia inaequalis]|nr:hypothetical protein Vi05172_g10595 [Venturia inaequalis]
MIKAQRNFNHARMVNVANEASLAGAWDAHLSDGNHFFMCLPEGMLMGGQKLGAPRVEEFECKAQKVEEG